jgi:hypothetical protein
MRILIDDTAMTVEIMDMSPLGEVVRRLQQAYPGTWDKFRVKPHIEIIQQYALQVPNWGVYPNPNPFVITCQDNGQSARVINWPSYAANFHNGGQINASSCG